MQSSSSVLDPIRRARRWLRLPRRAKLAHRQDTRNGPGEDPGIDAAVRASLDWLGAAQDHSTTADGGVARHFSVVTGWAPSYPETTGYIVPTMLDAAARYDDDQLLERGRKMLDWLVSIQLSDGAFQGGTLHDRPVVPVVFNTGQILIGLAAGTARFGEPYTGPMHAAARWLVEAQDDDGNWRKHASPFAGAGDKVYDTHVAWGLLEAAKVANDAGYAEAALRNIRWAISKQQANGWFSDCCLSNPSQPLTHTLAYALRGIIEGFLYSGDDDLLAAAQRTADGLMSQLRPDGYLPGCFRSDWSPAVPWSCLTGAVQTASCWLLLYQKTGNEAYLDAACRANEYVRRTVEIEGPPETRGAVRGSFPISGGYGHYQYLNWAAKFFIDSNLLEKDIQQSRQAAA